MPRPSWTRSVVTGLLPLAMAAGTLFYALVAVLATFIIDDLAITRGQLGLVVTAFALTGAAFSPIAGVVTDRIGARRAMLTTFACSAVGFAMISVVRSYLLLVAVALVLAVGQAIMNPGTNKMIAHEYPGGRRGPITGVKQSGVQMGSVVAGVAFPAIATAAGWRSVPLAVAATLGVVLAVAVLVLPRHPAEPVTHGSVLRGWSDLPPSIWWTATFALFMGLGGSPLFSFLPLYANEVLGVSEATAGLIVGVTSIFGVASRIGWSMFAERQARFPQTMLLISLIAIVAGVLTVAAGSAGVWMLWLASTVTYLSVSGWNSVAMLSVIVEAGPKLAGRGSGVILTGFLVGLAVSPPLFGWSVDRLDTYVPGFVGVIVCFVAAALTMVLRLGRYRAVPTAA